MNTAKRATVILYALLVLGSCGLLIDIPDVTGIRYCPQTAEQVLSEQEKPHIRFDIDVNRESVESLFSIRDVGGEVQGFFHWEGQTVTFRAQPELIPGRRYIFSFLGSFRDLRGVEYSVHQVLPFYFKQREESAPYALSSVPGSGETVASEAAIRILFSEAIDPDSLPRGLSIQPDTPFQASWANGATELTLTPKEAWKHCHCYTITVDEELLDTAGIPLAEPRQFVFWIQEDVDSPWVSLVEPALNLPAQLFPPTGSGMDEPVGLKDALRIVFSEAMDTDSTTAALILNPSLATSHLWIDASKLVVVPTDGFAPGTEYLLDFDDVATDRAGNPIAMLEAIRFTTVPGTIGVSTDFVHEGIQLGPEDYSTATALEIHPYPITSAADCVLSFTFTGAQFDSNGEKKAVQDAITLLCLFPDSGVADPTATSYVWVGGLNLDITFSDLQPSTVTQRIYYLLRIRGGPGAVATEEGSRLAEDLEQLLVTAVE